MRTTQYHTAGNRNELFKASASTRMSGSCRSRVIVPTSACSAFSGRGSAVLNVASSRRTVQPPVCGSGNLHKEKHKNKEAKALHKQHKKLADVLKAHRKKLGRLADAYAAAPAPAAAEQGMAVAAGSEAVLLQEVLAELQAVRQLLTATVPHGDSSSSSESDEEDSKQDDWWRRRQAQAATTTDAQTPVVAAPPLITVPESNVTSFRRATAPDPFSLTVHRLQGDFELPSQHAHSTNTTSVAPIPAGSTIGRVLVCQGSKCAERGALEVLRATSTMASTSYGNAVEVVPCKCLGRCKLGPAIRIKAAPVGAIGDPPPVSTVHTHVAPGDVGDIVAAHFPSLGQERCAKARAVAVASFDTA